jgi:hypothetical protein
VQVHPHPGGLQHQLNPDQTNPTLKPGGLSNGDSPGETPPREAVDRVTAMQVDRHGNRIWPQARALLDSGHARHATSKSAVAPVRSGSAAPAATTSAPTSPTYPTGATDG